MRSKVFLLSPANVSGLRAKQLMSPRAKFDAAQMYRSPEGVPIALAFAFMSALYFRGKITYAMHFAEQSDVYVIAPGFKKGGPFHKGVAQVCDSKLCGYIDKQGSRIWPKGDS